MWSLAAIFPSLGFPELIVILVIVVLLFGAGKLPQLGKGLGEGIRNLRRGLKGDEEPPRPELKASEPSKD